MKYTFISNEILRLDIFLTKKLLGEYSRIEIKNFIKDNKVKINKQLINKQSYKTKIGDNIEIECIQKQKETNLQPKIMNIDIVFENENLLIIDKPFGLTVHPGAGNSSNTLVNGLLHLQNSGKITLSNERGNDRVGIVHRLDKDTGGLMIIAKNNKSHRLLGELIKQHEIDRKYLALCHGTPVPPIGKIEYYMCRDTKDIQKMKICDKNKPKAKYSITNYKVLKNINNGKYSLIECKLQTGRTHQIRLHMFTIKHPLVGEQLYTNNNLKQYDLKNGFTHQMLYSYKLCFNDPLNGEKIEIQLNSIEIENAISKLSA